MFRFPKISFGLCNAGAAFQKLIDVLMSGLHFQTRLLYLSDSVVFVSTVDLYLELRVVVLERLHSVGLKLVSEN